MVIGLQHFVDRVGDGTGQPRLDSDAGEEFMHVQQGVAVALADRVPESPGTLYITTKRVIWLSDVDHSKGYSVDFLSLSLHAVSREPDAYPSPCIYTQIENDMDVEEDSEGSDSECCGEVELSRISEMRLIPSDPSQLDTIFDVFCECAELNPEPNQDQEEDNEWFYGDKDMAGNVNSVEDSEWTISDNIANPIGYTNGGDELACTVVELQITDQRFGDAEEFEGDCLGERI